MSKTEFAEEVFNIAVYADPTDHLEFNCPKCNSPMEVKEISTKPMYETICTIIYLKCSKKDQDGRPLCPAKGQRKFYWQETI